MVVVSSLSCVWLFVNPWTVAHRLLCPWISQARILKSDAISFSRASSWLRDGTHISCTAGRFITAEPAGKPKKSIKSLQKKHERNCQGDLSRMGSGPPVVWDPGTGLICIWIINLPLPLCAPFLGFLSVFNFLSSLALILAGFLKVQKSEFSQVLQNLVSWTQRAQSGHRERLLLTNSSNLVQWKVDF